MGERCWYLFTAAAIFSTCALLRVFLFGCRVILPCRVLTWSYFNCIVPILVHLFRFGIQWLCIHVAYLCTVPVPRPWFAVPLYGFLLYLFNMLDSSGHTVLGILSLKFLTFEWFSNDVVDYIFRTLFLWYFLLSWEGSYGSRIVPVSTFFFEPLAPISFPITCDFGALSNRSRTLSCLRFPSVSFRQPQKPVAGRIGYAHVFSPSILLLCHPLPLNSELFATLISSLLDAHEKRAELKTPYVDCEIRAMQAIRPPPVADASEPGKRRHPPSPVPREGGGAEDEIREWCFLVCDTRLPPQRS